MEQYLTTEEENLKARIRFLEQENERLSTLSDNADLIISVKGFLAGDSLRVMEQVCDDAFKSLGYLRTGGSYSASKSEIIFRQFAVALPGANP